MKNEFFSGMKGFWNNQKKPGCYPWHTKYLFRHPEIYPWQVALQQSRLPFSLRNKCKPISGLLLNL